VPPRDLHLTTARSLRPFGARVALAGRGLAIRRAGCVIATLGAAALAAAPSAFALGAAASPPYGFPISASPPGISGRAVESQTLVESHAAWSNSPTSYAYQWERCDGYGQHCVAITGGTAQSYKLIAADDRHTVRVRESAINATGKSGAVTSAPTAIVSASGQSKQQPSNAGLPLIDGAAYVGGRLQASTGAWAGAAPLSYAYPWQRCRRRCASIAGATRPAYTLVATDRGARIRVVVSASDRAGIGRAASMSTAPAGQSSASIQLLLARALIATGRAGRPAAIRAAGGYVTVFAAPLPGLLAMQWYYVPKGAHLGPPVAGKGKPQPVLVAEAAVTVKRAGKVKVKLRLTTDGVQLLRSVSAPRLTGEGTLAVVGRPVVVARTPFSLVH
jgi:hypothetical protein